MTSQSEDPEDPDGEQDSLSAEDPDGEQDSLSAEDPDGEQDSLSAENPESSKFLLRIQQTASVVLVLLIGYWLFGLARDGSREMQVSNIEAKDESDGALLSSEKNATTLRHFMGGVASTEEEAAAGEIELTVWKVKQGEIPRFHATLTDGKDTSPVEGFAYWLSWQAFARSQAAGGQWVTTGDTLRGEQSYRSDLPPGSYLILASLPPFDLEELSHLSDEKLFKLLQQGANQDKRFYVGLRVTPNDSKAEKSGGKSSPPPKPPPPIPRPPTPDPEAKVSPPAKQPATPKGNLTSNTKGESDTGALKEVSEQDNAKKKPPKPDVVAVPPRRDSTTPTLANLKKLKVEGALPEIKVNIGDFEDLTLEEIQQLDAKYELAIVMQPIARYASLYSNGYAVIDPTSGQVRDMALQTVMADYGRQALPIDNIPAATLTALKQLTKTNAWLHCQEGYRGLHFGKALLIPYQQHAKDTGISPNEIGSIHATLNLERRNGEINIVATDISVTPKKGDQ